MDISDKSVSAPGAAFLSISYTHMITGEVVDSAVTTGEELVASVALVTELAVSATEF